MRKLDGEPITDQLPLYRGVSTAEIERLLLAALAPGAMWPLCRHLAGAPGRILPHRPLSAASEDGCRFPARLCK
jgi:hypothetical protein